MTDVLTMSGVTKTFTMHLRGGIRLPVVSDFCLTAKVGECAVLVGPSGVGKSSILKMIYGSYRCDAGHILLNHDGHAFDIASATPRLMMTLRGRAMGYVSQFLRAVPRVPTIDVVAEPLFAAGMDKAAAREQAAGLLRRLNISSRLWDLPPATFSGGEQQRVNIARGFLPDRPLLLLDEPTASLDADNRAVVIDLIAEKKRRGTAIVAIVHDDQVRERISDSLTDVSRFTAAA